MLIPPDPIICPTWRDRPVFDGRNVQYWISIIDMNGFQRLGLWGSRAEPWPCLVTSEGAGVD